jgi:asparagine synthase (glutamine-hydrolysing)
MSARIAHRGPDGEGIHLNRETEINAARPQVGLVHRRLAILDLDPRANQPFTDQQGRWIVFNGEIYNFRELRAELEEIKPGYQWRTTGDTEVLLVAYDVWGKKCLDRLNGMFAFAIWDEGKGELFLARDRMGQKPLYFAEAPDRRAIAFGSEIAAVREMGWTNLTINPLSLVIYLRFGFLESTCSIFNEISRLAPGSYKWCTASELEWRGYFFANKREKLESGINETPQAATRRLVTQAVRRQLVADVPVGCFLSGGIDSSIIAAGMKQAAVAGQPVLSFSIGFDDPRYDERSFAAQVAEHLGTTHHSFVVKPDASADLPKLAAAFGEPFGDSSALPTHYLARETRQHVKVALSGDGGDELFGGYDRYRAMALAERLRHMPGVLLKSAGWWRSLPGTHPKSRLTRAKRFLESLSLPAPERYASLLGIFPWPLMRELMPTLAETDGAGWYVSMGFLSGLPVVEASLATDRLTYLPDDLLRKVDETSMMHALEVRSPFMDHELVQFAAGLTTDQLLKGGPKRMLREAFAQDLPAWVFKRKKMGFAIPIGEWFKSELRPMLRDNLFANDSFASQHFDMKVVHRFVEEHEQSRIDHSQRLYSLLMLELWWRTMKN